MCTRTTIGYGPRKTANRKFMCLINKIWQPTTYAVNRNTGWEEQLCIVENTNDVLYDSWGTVWNLVEKVPGEDKAATADRKRDVKALRSKIGLLVQPQCL